MDADEPGTALLKQEAARVTAPPPQPTHSRRSYPSRPSARIRDACKENVAATAKQKGKASAGAPARKSALGTAAKLAVAEPWDRSMCLDLVPSPLLSMDVAATGGCLFRSPRVSGVVSVAAPQCSWNKPLTKVELNVASTLAEEAPGVPVQPLEVAYAAAAADARKAGRWQLAAALQERLQEDQLSRGQVKPQSEEAAAMLSPKAAPVSPTLHVRERAPQSARSTSRSWGSTAVACKPQAPLSLPWTSCSHGARLVRGWTTVVRQLDRGVVFRPVPGGVLEGADEVLLPSHQNAIVEDANSDLPQSRQLSPVTTRSGGSPARISVEPWSRTTNSQGVPQQDPLCPTNAACPGSPALSSQVAGGSDVAQRFSRFPSESTTERDLALRPPSGPMRYRQRWPQAVAFGPTTAILERFSTPPAAFKERHFNILVEIAADPKEHYGPVWKDAGKDAHPMLHVGVAEADGMPPAPAEVEVGEVEGAVRRHSYVLSTCGHVVVDGVQWAGGAAVNWPAEAVKTCPTWLPGAASAAGALRLTLPGNDVALVESPEDVVPRHLLGQASSMIPMVILGPNIEGVTLKPPD
eukprot:TRINITY_DN11504_c0_g1_i10.p1 TRINITY_DN11504_c0_g1~~TRINITY_DN11504_c0_g1_i10.p1  ORF type:complete len:580 (-),score=103.31 TRINITY_DN11504_c0_g1_i10:126-1865(-)